MATEPQSRKMGTLRCCKKLAISQSANKVSHSGTARTKTHAGIIKTKTKAKAKIQTKHEIPDTANAAQNAAQISSSPSPFPIRGAEGVNSLTQGELQQDKDYRPNNWLYKEAATCRMIDEAQPKTWSRMHQDQIYQDEYYATQRPNWDYDAEVKAMGFSKEDWQSMCEYAISFMPRTIPVFTKMGNPDAWMGHPGY
jgi:hypothetical protein